MRGRSGRIPLFGPARRVALLAAALAWTGSAGAAQPDLQVLAFGADPSPAIGSTISVSVWVTNSGDAGAANVAVGLFLNRASPPAIGDTPDMIEVLDSVPAVPPSMLILMEVPFTGITNPTAETWYMYVMLDCFDLIPESEEQNNVSGPVIVDWTAGGPDLVIAGITLSDDVPLVGDTISVDVIVRNRGTRASSATTVSLFYDEPSAPSLGDVEDDSRWVIGLDVGEQTTATFVNVSSSSADLWDMYIVVNNRRYVGETDTTNNLAGPVAVAWLASGTDLVVTAVEPSEHRPWTNDTISVEVTVFNLGTVDAGDAFSVELFHNNLSTPAVGDQGDQSQPANPLASAAGATLTFTGITSPAVETWNMYAVVDNGDAVSEADETNNVAGPVAVEWGEPESRDSGCGGAHAGARRPGWLLPLGLAAAAVLFSRTRARQLYRW